MDVVAARERLEAIGARYLWIAYHDYAGLSRAKAVGPERILDALVHGVGFAKANWDLAIDDHQVPHPEYAADSGDFRLVPDPSTIRPLPHRDRAAIAYGWLTEPDATPWAGDPRGRLAAVQQSLADRGLVARVGIEAEFYVARPNAGRIVRARRSRQDVQPGRARRSLVVPRGDPRRPRNDGRPRSPDRQGVRPGPVRAVVATD